MEKRYARGTKDFSLDPLRTTIALESRINNPTSGPISSLPSPQTDGGSPA